MSSDNKGSKEVTTGFKYHMGIQLIPTRGPVDSVNRIIIGEREAFVGSVTDNATITINKPDLFGGDSREGGVVGDVEILMGAGTQGRSAYLAQHQGPNCSAYRGLLNIVFKGFQWSSGNPYFKAPWLDITRILKGWGDNGVWNEVDAKIGPYDMNPAHIVYQCLTDQAWGMGYPRSDIDDAWWRGVATQLKNENFGLSIEWDQQGPVEDFVAVILNHINGSVGVDVRTGKYRLKLIRDDYNVGDLLELNESNILEMKSFQRAAYGDAANEVVVTYTDRNQNDVPIAVQDIASIAAQGGVISVPRSYPGIREPALAARVALRDLKTLSTPLAKVTVITNRVMWDQEKGDVVKLVWPDEGINGVPFRVIDIDKGTLANGQITVTMVEDIFGLPGAAYTSVQGSQWVDTVVPPVAVDASMAIEAPYWEIVRSFSPADQEKLVPDYGFGLLIASRGAVRSSLNYLLASSPDNITYTNVGVGHFCAYGSLVAPLDRTTELVTLTGAFDLDEVGGLLDKGYAYIGNECVAVTTVDPLTGIIGIKRGILDTVPTTHAAGVKMFFFDPAKVAHDPTERVAGETVYYKPRPSSGIGTLDLDDAEVETLVMGNRASRPYPPGKFQINGVFYPSNIAGPDITVTWAHRDRVAQTVSFNDYLTGNIGPESGTTYRLRVYNGVTLLHTYDLEGSATSWSYPAADDTADGNLATLRITLHSVRDDLESFQGHDYTVSRTTATGSVVVGGTPAAPILAASNASFSVDLSWVMGDARTDIKHFELRVSTDPDFNHSEVLQYVLYPTLDFNHAMGVANSFRWYWLRVVDNAGIMSPWSNMVSGRGTTSATPATQVLAELNDLLTNGSGTNKIQMQSDRFSIVAPDGTKTPFAVVESEPGVWKILLNSDVVIGGSVDISNLTTGALPTNVMMKLGGGTIELDGAGEIRVFKDLNPNADFVRLTAGEIRFLRYIEGAYQSYNYLSRLEVGVANNNDTVLIPGYWKSQPRVIVSPASLGLYKASSSGQDQSVECQALSLGETFTGSGRWQFTARANLNIAAGTSTTAVNATSGDLTSTTTYSSGTYNTPSNCTSITPTVNLTSFRSVSGTTCQQRTVNWRVRYTGDGGGGAWRTKVIGSVTTAVTDSYTFTFPAAGSYSFWIEYSAADTTGTFVATGLAYEQSNTTLSSTTRWNGAQSMGITMPGYTPPAGWSVASVSWTYNGQYGMVTGYNVYFPDRTISNANLGGQITQFTGGGSAGSYSTSWPSVSWVYTGGGGGGSVANINMTYAAATIYIRRYAGYTASGQNRFDFASYGYSLASASILATGTLNWLAIGE